MKISFDSSNDDNSDEDNDENQTSEEKLTSTEGTFNAIVRISLNFRFIFRKPSAALCKIASAIL